jgi:hypothetical protein
MRNRGKRKTEKAGKQQKRTAETAKIFAGETFFLEKKFPPHPFQKNLRL